MVVGRRSSVVRAFRLACEPKGKGSDYSSACGELQSTDDRRPMTVEERQRRYSVQEEIHHARSLGLAVALGGAMGAAMGAATGHMGIWVAAGIAMYIVLTIVGGAWSEK